MDEKLILQQSMEFLETLIETFEDLEWNTHSADNQKRLDRAKECLRKAYVYAYPILHNL